MGDEEVDAHVELAALVEHWVLDVRCGDVGLALLGALDAFLYKERSDKNDQIRTTG